jgi:hypothetical protein
VRWPSDGRVIKAIPSAFPLTVTRNVNNTIYKLTTLTDTIVLTLTIVFTVINNRCFRLFNNSCSSTNTFSVEIIEKRNQRADQEEQQSPINFHHPVGYGITAQLCWIGILEMIST